MCRNPGIGGLGEGQPGQAPISWLRAGLPRARLPGPGADSSQLKVGTKLCRAVHFPPEAQAFAGTVWARNWETRTEHPEAFTFSEAI